MFRPLFILILALLSNSCFSLTNPFNHEPPHSYSSNFLLQYSSQIIIRKDTPSGEPIYTIQADFGIPASDSSDFPKTVQSNNFLLSLYTSHNILGGACQDLQPSTCESTYGCQSTPESTVNITLPYASVAGSTGQTAFYLDYLSYYSRQTPFVFPQNCVGGLVGGGVDTEQAVVGMIGMGINGSARNSFHREFPMFSIYLASNGAYGQIVFGLNPNILDESFSPLSFPASENWEISLENSVIGVGNNSIEFNGTAIFDLNLNSIGLPSEIYDNVISWLSTEYGVNCTGTSCKSATYYRLLPTLIISTQYSNLSILPTTYMSPNGGSMYTLHLSRIVTNNNNNTQQENSVKVNPGYENYIILGAPVMMSYYVTFQKHSNGPAIHLFKTTTKNNFMWVIIIGGLVLCTIMLILVILGIVIKKTGSRTVPERRRYNRYQQPLQSGESELSYTHVSDRNL